MNLLPLCVLIPATRPFTMSRSSLMNFNRKIFTIRTFVCGYEISGRWWIEDSFVSRVGAWSFGVSSRFDSTVLQPSA